MGLKRTTSPYSAISSFCDNSEHSTGFFSRFLSDKTQFLCFRKLQVLTKNGADKREILKVIDLKRHITKVKDKVNKVKITKMPKISSEKTQRNPFGEYYVHDNRSGL